MHDPVLNKLKSDAVGVLRDLWRLMCHQPEIAEWQHPRVNPAPPAMPMGEEPAHSGPCYFHLN